MDDFFADLLAGIGHNGGQPISDSEKKIVNDSLVALSSEPQTLVFRNNTGQAWQGRAVDVPVGEYVRVRQGMKILADARPVSFGLEGSGDINGATRGKPLMVECKTLTGRQREVQVAFGRAWEKAGGIYILVRSAGEAVSRVRAVASG